ncbi:MAG: 50S ribosomal protein L16 [Parcubacteria group bacterium RIFCSPHIGHO2_01_FULL_45_26]|nr:MAG: 50S ribosomal protein L16 [Parcubacteria group bacterium RIFCSPHIGHO2_01_FULL_45_26]
MSTLVPKKVKFRKWHTMRRNPKRVGLDTRGTHISFGSFGLQATTAGRIKSNQLESARKAISRSIKKTGKVWIRVFPDMPYTAKPAEVKLGKGKGDVQGYVAPVRAGRILFELDGLSKIESEDVLRKAGSKLPVRTRIVRRKE